jgi:hypothetical protein
MAQVKNTRGFSNTAGSAERGFTWNAASMDTTNVSNPPTEAEIIAIFGTAASVGSGFEGYIDDAGGGANVYKVASTGTKWVSWAGTIAV